MAPYLLVWRCHRRALARSVAAMRDRNQYRMTPTMRRKPTGVAASACEHPGNLHGNVQQEPVQDGAHDAQEAHRRGRQRLRAPGTLYTLNQHSLCSAILH